jgi:hypothetical protein
MAAAVDAILKKPITRLQLRAEIARIRVGEAKEAEAPFEVLPDPAVAQAGG